jgi:hypothetical protein
MRWNLHWVLFLQRFVAGKGSAKDGERAHKIYEQHGVRVHKLFTLSRDIFLITAIHFSAIHPYPK